MRKIIEGEYAVLYEDEVWWILQDKVYSQEKVVYRGSTKTVVEIFIDFVEIGGKLVPAVFYLPKNVIPLRIAMDHFNRIENLHKKRAKEFELYKKLGGGEV